MKCKICAGPLEEIALLSDGSMEARGKNGVVLSSERDRLYGKEALRFLYCPRCDVFYRKRREFGV